MSRLIENLRFRAAGCLRKTLICLHTAHFEAVVLNWGDLHSLSSVFRCVPCGVAASMGAGAARSAFRHRAAWSCGVAASASAGAARSAFRQVACAPGAGGLGAMQASARGRWTATRISSRVPRTYAVRALAT